MKVVLLALGSRGDVQPMVALGKALQASGKPVGTLNWAKPTPWSPTSCTVKSIGVPQTNEGEVLTLKAARFVAELNPGISG